jgi:hypothetical protein
MYLTESNTNFKQAPLSGLFVFLNCFQQILFSTNKCSQQINISLEHDEDDQFIYQNIFLLISDPRLDDLVLDVTSSNWSVSVEQSDSSSHWRAERNIGITKSR